MSGADLTGELVNASQLTWRSRRRPELSSLHVVIDERTRRVAVDDTMGGYSLTNHSGLQKLSASVHANVVDVTHQAVLVYFGLAGSSKVIIAMHAGAVKSRPAYVTRIPRPRSSIRILSRRRRRRRLSIGLSVDDGGDSVNVCPPLKSIPAFDTCALNARRRDIRLDGGASEDVAEAPS